MKLLYTCSKQFTIASFVSAIAQPSKVVPTLMFDVIFLVLKLFLIIPKHSSIIINNLVYPGISASNSIQVALQSVEE